MLSFGMRSECSTLGVWFASLLPVLLAGPLCAVTIEPGVYRLEWRVPEDDSDLSYIARRGVSLKPLAAEPEDGFASTMCYSGTERGFTVVVDESGGTGTGYDTAYVLPAGDETVRIESSKGLTFALKDNLGSLRCDDSRRVLEMPGLGKPVRLKLEVHMAADARNVKRPYFAELTLLGGWIGQLRTDSGQIQVQTVDQDGDGVYGEKTRLDPVTKMPSSGDAVVVGKASGGLDGLGNILHLGEVVSYAGKLYAFDVSPAGDQIEVRPYGGQTGKIVLQAKDGYGRAAACDFLMLSGGSSVLTHRGTGVMPVPPATYLCPTAVIRAQQGAGAGDFALVLQPDQEVSVRAGASATLRLGGVIRAMIGSGFGILGIRRGEEKTVRLNFQVGACRLADVVGPRAVTVNLRDSRGRLVHGGQALFGAGGSCSYTIRIPCDWRPGRYTMGISFDPSPYQKPVFATKRIQVL